MEYARSGTVTAAVDDDANEDDDDGNDGAGNDSVDHGVSLT